MHLTADQPSQNYEDENWEEKYEQAELPNLVPPVDDEDNLANKEDNIPLTPSKTRSGLEYQAILVDEIMAVGASIGGGFSHTSELRPMKYDEAMATPDAKEWEGSVDMEHGCMVKHKVWKVVKKEDVPAGAIVLDQLGQ